MFMVFYENTNKNFHTCDAVVGNGGCAMYIRGWVSHMALTWVLLFIFHIYLYHCILM